jgi:hypothetical protein
MGESVFKTFLSDIAGEADALSLTGRATLLWEEGLWVGLSAERSLLPGELNYFAIAQLDARAGNEVLLKSPILHHLRISHSGGRRYRRLDGENYTLVIPVSQVRFGSKSENLTLDF